MKLMDDGLLEIKDLEKKSPRLILQMFETVSKIISDNGIIKQEEEKLRDKIEFAMKTAVNLQTTLMAQNNENQSSMEAFLAVLKQDFEACFGSALS